MKSEYAKWLEAENAVLRTELLLMGSKLLVMTTQRNKFVHKYRKVCKAYDWLCHVTNRRFKAGELDHLPAVVRQYEVRRQKKDKG